MCVLNRGVSGCGCWCRCILRLVPCQWACTLLCALLRTLLCTLVCAILCTLVFTLYVVKHAILDTGNLPFPFAAHCPSTLSISTISAIVLAHRYGNIIAQL